MTAPSSPDRAALRATAEAATPGPWHVETPESVYGHDGGPDWADLRWVSDAATIGDDDPPWLGPMRSADAAYIAAANPSTVLALLDALDTAEAEIRERNHWIEDNLRELDTPHEPWYEPILELEESRQIWAEAHDRQKARADTAEEGRDTQLAANVALIRERDEARGLHSFALDQRDTAGAAVARVRALCDERAERDERYAAQGWTPIEMLPLDAVRAALDGAP